jgi:hypothetical protein
MSCRIGRWPAADDESNHGTNRYPSAARLIDASLERWHRRLTRAVNAIDELRKQRKRLIKPPALPPEARAFDDALGL